MSGSGNPVVLTTEMMERIERNRAAALEKRKMLQRDPLSVVMAVNVPDSRVAVTAAVQGPSTQGTQFRPTQFTEQRILSSNSAKRANKDNDLSSEQLYVWNEVMAGRSIFLTGCGGTGKSYLTYKLVDALKGKHGKNAVAVTASTGIAACQLGGVTVHNFAGIGQGELGVDQLIDRVSKNRKVCQRWKQTKCLIVDEISMLQGELFDKLEAIARSVRKQEKPFGGIQLLLIGDFLQLPPIQKNGNIQFCFESKSWKRVVENHIELKKVFRQQNMEFVDILNSIRVGNCTDEIVHKLCATSAHRFDEANGVQATRLYPINADVDKVNFQKLQELPGKIACFEAEDSGDSPFIETLDKNCLAPSKLSIKPGAQVMLLKNIDVESGLTNGTRGVVESIVEIDEKGAVELAPRVVFEVRDGMVTQVVKKETFSIEAFGKTVASRTQFPLRLAYAITIHKCQGMTLSKVELSLRSVFEFGQAYVALSRVTDLNGLRLLDFNRSAVRAHPRVLDFYKFMSGCQQGEGPEKRRKLLPETFGGVPGAQVVEARKNPLFSYDE